VSDYSQFAYLLTIVQKNWVIYSNQSIAILRILKWSLLKIVPRSGEIREVVEAFKSKQYFALNIRKMYPI